MHVTGSCLGFSHDYVFVVVVVVAFCCVCVCVCMCVCVCVCVLCCCCCLFCFSIVTYQCDVYMYSSTLLRAISIMKHKVITQ